MHKCQNNFTQKKNHLFTPMENYFLKIKKIKKANFYSTPNHITNHDALFLLNQNYLILYSNKLSLINKNTHIEEKNLLIDLPIHCISVNLEKNKIIIVNDKEILMLDQNIDLLSKKSMQTQKCTVSWCVDFVIISSDKIRFYNFSLEVLFENYEYSPIDIWENTLLCFYHCSILKIIDLDTSMVKLYDMIRIEGEVYDMKFISNEIIVLITNENNLFNLSLINYNNETPFYKYKIPIQKSRLHKSGVNSFYLQQEDNFWLYILEKYYVHDKNYLLISNGKYGYFFYYEKKKFKFDDCLPEFEIEGCINCVSLDKNISCFVTFQKILLFRGKYIFLSIENTLLHKYLQDFNRENKITRVKNNNEKVLIGKLNTNCIGFVKLYDNKLYIVYGFFILVYSIIHKSISKIYYLKYVNRVYILKDTICFRNQRYLFYMSQKIKINIKDKCIIDSFGEYNFFLIGNRLKIYKNEKLYKIGCVYHFQLYKAYLLIFRHCHCIAINLITNEFMFRYIKNNKYSFFYFFISRKDIFLSDLMNSSVCFTHIFQQEISDLIICKKYQQAIEKAKVTEFCGSAFANKKYTFGDIFNNLTKKYLIVDFVYIAYWMFPHYYKREYKKMSFGRALQEIKNTKNFQDNTKQTRYVFHRGINTKEKFLEHVINKLGDENKKFKVKIYKRLDMLEQAMYLVQKDYSLFKFIKTEKTSKEIINISLSFYDLKFAEYIISKYKKYQLIERIKEFEDEISRRIEINKILERRETVVFYLAQKNNDDERNYILENKMMSVLPIMKNITNKKMEEISFLSRHDKNFGILKKPLFFYECIEADFLYENDKIASIEIYYNCGLYQRSIDVALELNDWVGACKIISRIKRKTKFTQVIKFLTLKNQNSCIAYVYLKYLKNKEKAYFYYKKSYWLLEAKNLNPKKFKKETDQIILSAKNEINNYFEYLKTLIIRFSIIYKELKNRLARNKKTDQNLYSTLRSKIRYILNQISVTVNGVNYIKTKFSELKIVIDVEDLREEIELVYNQAYEVYGDGEDKQLVSVTNLI